MHNGTSNEPIGGGGGGSGGVDKKLMYAPRAKYTSTKNLIQSATGNKYSTPKMSMTTKAAKKIPTKGLYSRRHFERYDKGSLSNKIVVKSLVHRVGGKRKTGANFITFNE